MHAVLGPAQTHLLHTMKGGQWGTLTHYATSGAAICCAAIWTEARVDVLGLYVLRWRPWTFAVLRVCIAYGLSTNNLQPRPPGATHRSEGGRIGGALINE